MRFLLLALLLLVPGCGTEPASYLVMEVQAVDGQPLPGLMPALRPEPIWSALLIFEGRPVFAEGASGFVTLDYRSPAAVVVDRYRWSVASGIVTVVLCPSPVTADCALNRPALAGPPPRHGEAVLTLTADGQPSSVLLLVARVNEY